MTSETSATRGEVQRVALVYMLTGLALFLLMGLLGLLMRLNHAGILPLPPDLFYRIMTLHGSGMISGLLLAAMGGLASVLGRSLRLDPRWLWIGFVLYFMGSGLALIATLFGRFAAGWTVLYPLPFDGKTWGITAAWTMYAAFLLIGLSFLVFCITVLRATLSAYGSLGKALAWKYLFTGGRETSGPLPRPAEIVGTAIAVIGIIDVLAGTVYLLSPLIGTGPLALRDNALLEKNLVMFFGHTLANTTIYITAGLLYATLPLYAGRQWKTSWPLVLAINLLFFLVLIPYPHHLYQDFAQPLSVEVATQAVSYAIGFPVVLVTVIAGLSLIYRSGLRWSVPAILMAVGLWGWVLGGIGATIDTTIAVNQVTHNTLWVPAHFHTYYLLGVVTFILAYAYHITGELSGTPGSASSRIAAWLFALGGAGFVLMFFFSGGDSIPRRYAVHLPQWQIYARIAVPFVILQAIGLGWIAVEIAARLRPAWKNTGSMKP